MLYYGEYLLSFKCFEINGFFSSKAFTDSLTGSIAILVLLLQIVNLVPYWVPLLEAASFAAARLSPSITLHTLLAHSHLWLLVLPLLARNRVILANQLVFHSCLALRHFLHIFNRFLVGLHRLRGLLNLLLVGSLLLRLVSFIWLVVI